MARSQARQLDLVLRVCAAAPMARFGVDEVAFALAWTRAATDAQAELARQLICGLPEVFAALARGEIDLPKARVFADTLQSLEPQVAAAVAASVLPVAAAKTTAQLRRMLHRRALAADPGHARKQHEEGTRQRRVVVEPAADGTARLTAFGLAPDRAQAVFERVTAIAKARRLSGATATMDQLRADVVLDLLEGNPIDATPGPRRGVVELIVGWETLAGLDDNPGTLHGFGPVAADIARQCAAANLEAQWRFSVIDPDNGQLLFHGITRARPGNPQRPQPRPNTAQPTQPAQSQPAQTHTAQASAKQAQPAQTRPAQPAQAGSAMAGTAQTGTAQTGTAQAGTGSRMPCPPWQDPHARFPNAAMTAWIRARDRTCRAPGCRIPARACQIDHTIDFAHGGRTTHDDLGPLCGRHHVMKHEGGWTLLQIRPGHFIWISPANRVYHIGPEPP